MTRRTSGVPPGPTIKRQCQSIDEWPAYLKSREGYKLEGLLAKEAAARAYTEHRIKEKYEAWRQRQSQAEILGSGVPLTPAEIKEVKPDYRAPRVTKGSTVGDAVLSLPEQVRWVKQRLAKARNGEGNPTEYPNADALYWYQIAITRPVDFDKIVMKVEAPERDADDLLMRDGEYQFSQIESQLQQAVKEVGGQLSEIESRMAEPLDGFLPSGAEGACVESSVPA